MGQTKNVLWQEYNGTDYDTLYPKTTADNVAGAVKSVNNKTPALNGDIELLSFDSNVSFNAGLNSNNSISVGTEKSSTRNTGCEIDFHFNGNTATTSKIIENANGQLLLDAVVKLKNALDVTQGGTGASTTVGMTQNVFGNAYTDAQSVTSYPTKPGIYRTIGTNIFRNLQSAHGNYGVLVIFKAGYGLHIYVDESGRVFYGRSGDTFGEPTWYSMDTTVSEFNSSDGVWSVRQYANGWAECWGSKSYSGAASGTWGSLKLLVCDSPNYPITFKTYPYVQRDVLLNTGNAVMLASWGLASITNCGQFGLVRQNSETVNATVKFYVRGQWK